MVSLPSFVQQFLPSSDRIEVYKTRAQNPSRVGLSAFFGAQLVLVSIVGLFLVRASPSSSGLSRPYSWGGFDEVCNGAYGEQVCTEYGPHNVKLSRSYEGSGTRFREVFRRAILNDAPLRVAILGGSVSGGHGIGNMGSKDIWVQKTFDAINEAHPHSENSFQNGAVGAVGSDYFAACWENRISKEVDIIFVEHGINDDWDLKFGVSMEDLLRGLLDLPSRPAVMIARTVGLEVETIAVGGDEHYPVGVYYDVPVLSLRSVVLPLLIQQPERASEYFVGGDNVDLRHINQKSHHALGAFAASYILDQHIVAQRQVADLRASGHEDWRQLFGKHRMGAHDWPGIDYLGNTPKLRLFSRYEPDRLVVPTRTQCFSMDLGDRVVSHLLPQISNNTGWSRVNEGDQHLWAGSPGASFEIELDVTGGKVQIYYPKSGDGGSNLGMVDCWIDDSKDTKVRVDGYRDGGQIGVFTTIAEDLQPGKHTLHVELTSETNHPEGGTEFRIIAVVSL